MLVHSFTKVKRVFPNELKMVNSTKHCSTSAFYLFSIWGLLKTKGQIMDNKTILTHRPYLIIRTIYLHIYICLLKNLGLCLPSLLSG